MFCAASSATVAASSLQRLLLSDLSHRNEEDGSEKEGKEGEDNIDEEFDLVSKRAKDSEVAELFAHENTVADVAVESEGTTVHGLNDSLVL